MTELEKWKNECAELNQEIAKLREELELSEKYGRTKEDVELINDLSRKVHESRVTSARLRAALENILSSAQFINEHMGYQFTQPLMRWREHLESGDGEKQLEAVKEAFMRLRDSATSKKLRDAFGLSLE